MGTRLGERGVPLPAPAWSAHALRVAPDVVRDVHREYAAAGAVVHTANTFRTREADVGRDWAELATLAVRLAREAVPADHRVAGSIAPVEDCYRPALSPADPRPHHRALARTLAGAGVDLLICETFPHVGEALVAVEEAVATGVETWLALTAGPTADLLTPEELREGALAAVERGASAVLVNCVPADRTLGFLEGLARAGVPFGAYANAGAPDDGIGWGAGADGAERYARLALRWVDAGATLVGGCCGTGPEHVAALRRALGASARTG